MSRTSPGIPVSAILPMTLTAAALVVLSSCAGPAISADFNPFSEQERRNVEARERTGTPLVMPCGTEPGVYSRVELGEFWNIIRTSQTGEMARSRVEARFKRIPLIFDGCTRNDEKFRVVIREVGTDPFEQNIGLPRLRVLTDVVWPPRAAGSRWVTIDLGAVGGAY